MSKKIPPPPPADDGEEPGPGYVNQDPDFASHILNEAKSVIEEAFRLIDAPVGFVERVQEFIKDYGLTMEQFAEMCQKDIPTFDVKNLNNWFSKRHQPKSELAEKVERCMAAYAKSHSKQMSLSDMTEMIDHAAKSLGMTAEEARSKGLFADNDGNILDPKTGKIIVNLFDALEGILALKHMSKGRRLSMMMEIIMSIEHHDCSEEGGCSHHKDGK